MIAKSFRVYNKIKKRNFKARLKLSFNNHLRINNEKRLLDNG